MTSHSSKTSDEARNILMKLCSVKEMCSHDLKRKMELWGISVKEQEEILKYLEKEKYFSNKRFSTAFISDKSRFQKWGRIKIKHALMARGISEDMIHDLMQEAKETDYKETLESLLIKKSRSLKASKSKLQLKASLYRFAVGRGFEPELIFRVLDKLMDD